MTAIRFYTPGPLFPLGYVPDFHAFVADLKKNQTVRVATGVLLHLEHLDVHGQTAFRNGKPVTKQHVHAWSTLAPRAAVIAVITDKGMIILKDVFRDIGDKGWLGP